MNIVWQFLDNRKKVKTSFLVFMSATAVLFSLAAKAAKIKDIADVKGVRENILIGYGVVVGLKGSGDSSTEVTSQSLGRLFGKLGLDIQDSAAVKSKNAAAVIVTSKLPAFSRIGSKIDVTVSSIGDAKSLEGGVLLVTPLRAGDQNVYAVAQGPVSIGSLANGSSSAFPTVARVVGGATIEKDIDTNFSSKNSLRLALHEPDFTTAARVSALINTQLGGKFASARDSGTIDVIVPFNYEGQSVELLAILENIQVNTASKAKVVLNERTGTVILGGDVTISPVAISHGDLSVEISAPRALASAGGDGVAPAVAAGPIDAGGKKFLMQMDQTANVKDLVNALNILGVQPKDLTAIFQNLRKAGALHAELELM